MLNTYVILFQINIIEYVLLYEFKEEFKAQKASSLFKIM